MIDVEGPYADTDTIEKYILGGEWENQYPQAIEYLLAEVKRLRELLGETEYRLDMAEDVLGRSDWYTIYREIIDEDGDEQ